MLHLLVDTTAPLYPPATTTTAAAVLLLQNALLKEVGILAKLTHPNLVRFCGVCLDPPLVVMEFYRNGSMFKMLECARAAVQQGRSNKVGFGPLPSPLSLSLISSIVRCLDCEIHAEGLV